MYIEFKKGIYLPIVDSTNNYIQTNNISFGTWVIAEDQTNGRGRKGKIWHSLGKSKIFFSAKILLKRSENPLTIFPLLIAFSIYKTILTFFPHHRESLKIKWPNDIYLDENKIAGILIESNSQNDSESIIVLGIGINLSGDTSNDKDFKYSFLTNTAFDKEQKVRFVEFLINEINNLEPIFNSQERFLETLNLIDPISYLKNKEIQFTYENEIRIGKYIGIDKNGFLLILSDKNTITLLDYSDIKVL